MLGSPRSRVFTLVALAALLAASWGASARDAPLTLPVRLGALTDSVLLHPADPRSEGLRAARPGVADGLYEGHLATSGARVHLAWRGAESLGLVMLPGRAVWVGVVDGALMELPPEPIAPIDIDEEPVAHAAAAAPTPSADADGVLQILLDMDFALYVRARPDWEFHQLAAAHLASLPYEVQLGVAWEVVQQHAWTELDPFQVAGGDFACDELARFRSYWESVSPTTADPREDAHLMQGNWEGSWVGCGYPSSLETSSAYSLSKFYLGTATPPSFDNGPPARLPSRTSVLLMAHEVGHNFGGSHGRAAPTPGGVLDPFLLGLPSPGILAGTIMYPVLLTTQSGVFSDCPAQCGVLQTAGVMRDGGNAGFMRAHAGQRI